MKQSNFGILYSNSFFSGLLESCDRTHSALMFAALITVAHFPLEIFGRPALGRNQNGVELLQARPGRVKETASALGQEYSTLSAGSELGSVDMPAAFQGGGPQFIAKAVQE